MNEKLFEKITESLPGMVAVYDIVTGEYIYVNKAIKKLLGYSPEEFTKKGFNFVVSLVHPEDLPEIVEQNNEALKKANSNKRNKTDKDPIVNFEYRMKHKKGHWVWLHTSGSVFERDSKGKVQKVLNISIDITARKEAEANLIHANEAKIAAERERDRIYKHFMQAPIPIAILKGPNHVYEFSNPLTNKTLKVDNPVGMSIKELFPNNKETIKMLDNVFKTGEAFNVSGHAINLGNETIYVNATYQPLRNDKGEIEGIFTTGVEVTDQVVAKQKIKESEERYKAFLSNSTEGIWRFELDKPIPIRLSVSKQINLFFKRAYLAECNDAMAKMYGLKSAQDIIGARLSELMPKDQKNLEYLRAFIKNNYKLSNAESYEKDKDGKEVIFSNNLVGIVENGLLIRAWGTQKNITVQKKMENELRESEERFRQLADSMPQIVWTATPEGQTDYFNKRWYEYTGFKTVSGDSSWTPVLHPQDVKRTLETFYSAVKTGEPYQIEYRFKDRKKGGYRWFLGRALPVKDKQGKIVKWFGTSTDIDSQKRAISLRDDFISIASHELKTPVTSLKMFTQILEREATNNKTLKFADKLNKMDQQIDKLSVLIKDLLDVSKMQHGKLEFHDEEFNINQLVRETVNSVQPTTNKHKIQVLGTITKPVWGDRDRIGQVITNLLTNAIKYSPSSSRVEVKMSHQKGMAHVSVKDFGIGIDKKYQERIFDRFYRVEGQREKTFPGMGIGLYISYEIIKRHGGNMTVESSKNKGSTFSFYLPFKRDRQRSLPIIYLGGSLTN
jgi:PAS domain S-box-containing protein